MVSETSHHSSADDNDLPPGTFYLIRRHESREGRDRDTILLDPVPSKDPNQPLNWSTRRKVVNFTLVMAISCIVFTALSIQQNFWQQMVVDMNLSYQQLNNATSVNYVGLACGCIIFIPFSRKYGRRPVYLVSTALMLVTALWSAKMTTLWELNTTNLIQGLAGATNEAITQMTIADLFFVQHRGTANGLYVTMVMCGAFLTPILAGVQATNQGWRWSYWTLSIVNAVVFVLFVLFYEETKFSKEITAGLRSPADIMVNEAVDPESGLTESNSKAAVDGAETKATCKKIDTISAHPSSERHELDDSIPMNPWTKRLALVTPSSEPIWPYFYRPFQIMLCYPTVLFTALQYSALIAWLTFIATVIALLFPLPPYNFNPAQVGMMTFGPFVGNLLGSIYGGLMVDRSILFFSRRNKGYYEPEMRLYILHLPAICLSGGIIMFGVTIARGMHWIYPSVGGALFGFGLGSIGDAVLTLVIDSYPEIVSDAMTGIAFLRNAVSIGIPFAIIPWMNINGTSNMFVACGLMSLAFSGLIIPMVLYGRKSRARMTPLYRSMAARSRGLN